MIIFGLNNRVDEATLSSDGAFATGLPLANLQSPLLAKTARTTSTAAFSITIDCGALPVRNIGAVCLAGHNLSRDAVVAISINNGGTVKAASGSLSPWPFLASDDPYYDAHNFSAAIVDTARIATMAPSLLWFAAANQSASKVVITIDDSTNAAGYIEIGRVFAGELSQPVRGEEWADASWGLVDFSQVQVSKRRVKFAYKYPVIRTVGINFKHLSQGEAIGGLKAAQRAAGLTGEVLVAKGIPAYTTIGAVSAPDSNWFAHAFLGNFTALDPLTNPYLDAYAMSINIEEVAA
ncbi:MAG: hypothetical protein PHH59_16390 [Methylovulum sp.]|uniref:hypothetical protein n=1 Tax=Methylovulum sp. TaxID=1916980 RepID=UPI002613F186|nr:hypothetical protein [Methylovulum sp.]MDD2725582.1 hypothetical protein [Methylovulum sp.]